MRRHSLPKRISTLSGPHSLSTPRPASPKHMHPVIALVTADVEMDVLGIAYSKFSELEREAVVRQHPRISPGRAEGRAAS